MRLRSRRVGRDRCVSRGRRLAPGGGRKRDQRGHHPPSQAVGAKEGCERGLGGGGHLRGSMSKRRTNFATLVASSGVVPELPRGVQGLCIRMHTEAQPCRSKRRMISACCAFASGDPLPPRPEFSAASTIGVEPLLFLRRGSAPPSRSAFTAAAQRVRTAR